jgi:hypothetical protein
MKESGVAKHLSQKGLLLAQIGLLLAGRWLALVLVTEVLAALLLGVDAAASVQVLLRATIILFLGTHILPRPQPEETVDFGSLALWCLMCALALPAGVALAGGELFRVQHLLPMAGGVALLVLMFCTVSLQLGRWLNDRRLAARICTAALLLSLSLPLWAAPLALYGIGDFALDTIIALCPVSYLATLAEIDYLRSDWWYRHMPYGGLRYNYADPLVLTLVMLSSVAVMTALGKLRWRGAGA